MSNLDSLPLAPSSPPSPSSAFCPRLDPFRHLTLSEVAIIAEFLPPIDIIRSQLVCRTWRTILDSYHISRVALIKHFPLEKETGRFKKARQEESLRVAVAERTPLGAGETTSPITTTTTTTTTTNTTTTTITTTTNNTTTTTIATTLEGLQQNDPSTSTSPETPPLLPSQPPNSIPLRLTPRVSESSKKPARKITAKGKGKRPALPIDPSIERSNKREREEEATSDIDARLQFRRCVYRAHTRMMGMPTQVLWHRLEPGEADGDVDYALEWDINGGHVAWISGNEVLHVQNIYSGAHGKVNFVEEMVERGITMVREEPKINVQIGDNVVCITLNYYETNEDGYGSGRAAQCLIFEAEPLQFLWHTELRDERLLGEVDTTRGRFSYIRKRPKRTKYGPWGITNAPPPPPSSSQTSNQSDQPLCETHLVVRDLVTGEFMKEILLERGHELTLGDVFFIIVTDSSFRRLICLYQPGHMNTPLGEFVCARIYSLDDPDGIAKVLDTRALAKNPDYWVSTDRIMGIDSDIYMDYPPRTNMFDIAEGMYTWARIPSIPDFDLSSTSISSPASSSSSSSSSFSSSPESSLTTAACSDLLRIARSLPALQAPLTPPIIPHHSWNVLTAGTASDLYFTQNRYLSTFSLSEDAFRQDADVPITIRGQMDHWARERDPLLPWERSKSEGGATFDMVRRFEVFLPSADAAAVFVATGNGTFNVDMAEYRDAPVEVAERWERHYEELKSTNLEGHEQRGTSLINGILKRMLEVEVSADDKSNEEEEVEFITTSPPPLPTATETTASLGGEDLDVEAIRKAFKEAGLTPSKLAVPVTRTLRRAGRRTLGTGRLRRWTAMNDLETLDETVTGAGKHATAGHPNQSTSTERSYTDPNNNSEIILPEDPKVPIFIDPTTGNIGVKGYVSPSFLQSVQWTEDFLAIQTRFLALSPRKLDQDSMECRDSVGERGIPRYGEGEGREEGGVGDGNEGGRNVDQGGTDGEGFEGLEGFEERVRQPSEEVNVVVVFDFRAPW